jgi:hypothetical protein
MSSDVKCHKDLVLNAGGILCGKVAVEEEVVVPRY